MLDKPTAADKLRASLAPFTLTYGSPLTDEEPDFLGDRLTAGRQILALAIKVRILVPQPVLPPAARPSLELTHPPSQAVRRAGSIMAPSSSG